MSYEAADAQRELFRVQCRMSKTIGVNKAAFARMTIAHCKRLGLPFAFWEGVLARELATTPQARALAESAMTGALMLSNEPAKRERAGEMLRGFVSRAA